MDIVLALDHNRIEPTAACLKSIECAHRGQHVVVHLLHSELPRRDEATLRQFCSGLEIETRLVTIDYSEIRNHYHKVPQRGFPVSCMFRLLLASYLPEEVDRVLYLDVDTIVLSSLAELFRTDLGEHVATVCHNKEGHLAEFGIGPDDYFNSGVILINLDKWRSENIERKLFEVLQNYPEKLLFPDQCALNIVLANQVVYVSSRYNYYFSYQERPAGFEAPVVIHYLGFVKPWEEPFCNPWTGAYIEFAAMTPWPVDARVISEFKVPVFRAYRRRFLKAIGLRK